MASWRKYATRGDLLDNYHMHRRWRVRDAQEADKARQNMYWSMEFWRRKTGCPPNIPIDNFVQMIIEGRKSRTFRGNSRRPGSERST